MTAKNDITGDSIKSKLLSEEGRKNWDNIFSKKEEKPKNPCCWKVEYEGDWKITYEDIPE